MQGSTAMLWTVLITYSKICDILFDIHENVPGPTLERSFTSPTGFWRIDNIAKPNQTKQNLANQSKHSQTKNQLH